MPEYNNGIPNAQQPSQEPNTTLPGLSDNTMAQSQVGGLQVSQMQNNQNMHLGLILKNFWKLYAVIKM